MIKKGFNRILNQTRNTPKDNAIKEVFEMFGPLQFYDEKKNTSSGHNAIHYDITPPTPLQCCECQLQTILDYTSDKTGPTNAHATMEGKRIMLIPIPDGQECKHPSDKLENYEFFDGLYYSKKDIEKFKKLVSLITPWKFRISYDLGTIKIERYTTYQNYLEIAKELPLNDPYREEVDAYFENLKRLPESFFTFPYSIVADNIKLSNIRSFIEEFKQKYPLSNSSDIEQIPSDNNSGAR